MNQIAVFLFLFITVQLHAQNYKAVVDRIYTIEESKDYANKNRGVNFTVVNLENDVLLFDEIDTTDLKKSIGKTISLLGRNTKLIQDTIIRVAKIHTIYFDLNTISPDTADLLMNQIKEDLDMGWSYWQLKMKYNHTSAIFKTGPVSTDIVKKEYNLDPESFENNERYSMDYIPNVIGILIVAERVHNVPAYYSISYNIIH